MRSARTTALVCVHPGESVTRPGRGRHQTGKLGRPLTPPPRNLQRPHRKIHQAFFLMGCLCLILCLLLMHLVHKKSLKARTKNTLGWSISAVSEERWLTFSKFNSHSFSNSPKTTHHNLQHRTPSCVTAHAAKATPNPCCSKERYKKIKKHK